jgi:hypothetical protein
MNEDHMLDLLRTCKRGPSEATIAPPISWAVIFGAFLKAQWDTSQLFVVFYQLHPVLNRSIEVLF